MSGRYLKTSLDFSKIISQKVTSVKVKGKFIYWNFPNDSVLFSTLGMSGIYSTTKTTHSRIRFILDNSLEMFYNDVRNFGTMKVTDVAELSKKLKELGPDMLNEPCSISEFKKILLKYPNKLLGIFLLDQKRISSIGNIYKSEICYSSKLDPSRTLSSLSEIEIISLYTSIVSILAIAYEFGGSSQKDFQSVSGELGTYLQELSQVYRRTHTRSGLAVHSTVLVGDDRTTWWCPDAQF